MAKPTFQLWSTVLGAPDAGELASFYRELLGWEVAWSEPGWVRLSDGTEGRSLAFQSEVDYRPPVWPPVEGHQQMMMHLDILVDDVDAAVGHAVGLGARLADFQPQDDVRVCLDPAGHPFCLFAS